jgi:DNA-binding transcriptional LysR family regulator
MDIQRIDLNLLRVLDVLLREQHVSRAAVALHLSQPATSAALARLREALNDPLLTRGVRGMQPTERAIELAPKVRALLESIGQVLAPTSVFDAKTADLTFSIASTDYFIELASQPLAQRLRQASPNMRFAWLPIANAKIVERLERGELDIAITSAARAPDSLRSKPLLKESFIGIARKKHPIAKTGMSLDSFCQLPHTLVSPSGNDLFHGAMDDALAARGLSRRVVFSVPQFRFAIDIVKTTDTVAVFPKRLANQYRGQVNEFELPLPPPSFEIVMLWHERTHRSAPHQWLREQLTTYN